MEQQHTSFARQLERGDQAIREAFGYWMTRSGRTTRQMASIASWALGTTSPLSHSVISRIANRKQGVSIAALVAMAELNAAIYAWHQDPEKAKAERGLLTTWQVKPDWLDACIWLPRPDSTQPLDLPDFLHVLVGRLQLPYLLPADPPRCAERLPALLDRSIIEAGFSPTEGIRRLLAAYPSSEHRERFQALLLGQAEFTNDDLESELMAIAQAIRELRGLPLGSYGPDQLMAELQE